MKIADMGGIPPLIELLSEGSADTKAWAAAKKVFNEEDNAELRPCC